VPSTESSSPVIVAVFVTTGEQAPWVAHIVSKL
jgi:hypothetical protein